MELYFRSHAVQRMQERKVSVDEVQLVIDSPDGKIRQSKDKVVLYKKINGRKDNLIAVVAVEKDKLKPLIEIISVLVNFEVYNEDSA